MEDYQQKIQEAKVLFDQVNKRVREQIPEYHNIYTTCSPIIADLERCLAQSKTESDIRNCQIKMKELKQCTDKATCPIEFEKYIKCITEGNKDCKGFDTQLKTCLNKVSERVMVLSKEELNKLATKEQKDRLAGFLPF